ncbi:hypothetical protein BGX34_004392 [Mortierella sp. NVP85]|nr:hypothetical protein BGX34_004392 [Mortierella sp. NVP85]
MVPHELLVKIFYNLEERPQHRHTSTSSISFSSSLSLDRTHILACALVCRDWYYAAVDTLWREVDLQSVESFILFSRALDPGFSYIEGPSSVQTTLYHTTERSVDGADHSNRQQDSMDEDEDEGSKVDSDQEDHENEMSGDIDDLHQQQQQQPQQQGSFRSVYCGQGGRRQRRAAFKGDKGGGGEQFRDQNEEMYEGSRRART